MAEPKALEKLRAVLDYAPGEAARALPGDPQEYYDALERRLSRTVAVKRLVRRRVLVEEPEAGEEPEPEGPAWEPPPPGPAPEPGATEPQGWAPEPKAAAAEEASVVETVAAAAQPSAVAEEEPGSARDFFDVVRGGAGAEEMEPVEPEVSLSEAEWQTLEAPPEVPEEEAEAPVAAGEEPAPPEAEPELEEDAFEVVVPGEQGQQPLAEFEVEPAELPGGGFEVVAEEEAVVEEGEEPPFQVNEFTLYRRDVRTRGGRARSQFFFSAEPVPDARPSALPEGYDVVVKPETGIPVVRRSPARALPVTEIEGIGPVMAERLTRAGVRTTRDLLRIDAPRVSEETGISERLLRNFQAMANLLQLPGLHPEQAAALVYAGVRSLEELKRATPGELAKAMHRAAKEHQLQLRGKMTASRVRGWQERIARLERR